MIKRAYSVQMSFDIPDSEKRIAEKAKESFIELNGYIKLLNEYLDMIYDPFKNAGTIDPAEVLKNRVLLRKIRDKTEEKFQKITRRADKCMILMREFSSDTDTEDMMNAFTDSLEDVEKQIEIFLSIFSNLDNTDFCPNLIASIDAIKKQGNQVRQLVKDRIVQHIDTNILAKNWTSRVSEKYRDKVHEKLPWIVELFKERQKASQ